MSVLQDDSDFNAGLAELRNVCDVPKIISNQLDGGARMFTRGFRFFIPFSKNLATAFDLDAISNIIAENDVETRDDGLLNQFWKGDKLAGIGSKKQNVDVSGENELIARVTVVVINNPGEPLGKIVADCSRTAGGLDALCHL